MLKRFTPVLVLTAVCWLVFGADVLLWKGQLAQHGIVPRHLGGLVGILWAPFLHASFQHLAANTVPLLILGGILCGRSRSEFATVVVGGALLGGGLTWLLARNGCHIGASGLIFSLFGYLASLALFNRTLGSLLLSLVCLVAYGGMLVGILPTREAISWDGHAAGLVAGVFLAWFNAKVKRTELGPKR